MLHSVFVGTLNRCLVNVIRVRGQAAGTDGGVDIAFDQEYIHYNLQQQMI